MIRLRFGRHQSWGSTYWRWVTIAGGITTQKKNRKKFNVSPNFVSEVRAVDAAAAAAAAAATVVTSDGQALSWITMARKWPTKSVCCCAPYCCCCCSSCALLPADSSRMLELSAAQHDHRINDKSICINLCQIRCYHVSLLSSIWHIANSIWNGSGVFRESRGFRSVQMLGCITHDATINVCLVCSSLVLVCESIFPTTIWIWKTFETWRQI